LSGAVPELKNGILSRYYEAMAQSIFDLILAINPTLKQGQNNQNQSPSCFFIKKLKRENFS